MTEFLPIINDSKSLGLEFISEDATLQQPDELLEHEIVHHDAELLVCELGLKIGDFLTKGASEVFWQHTRIISIPAIAFNDLFGALLIVVKLAANHVDR